MQESSQFDVKSHLFIVKLKNIVPLRRKRIQDNEENTDDTRTALHCRSWDLGWGRKAPLLQGDSSWQLGEFKRI